MRPIVPALIAFMLLLGSPRVSAQAVHSIQLSTQRGVAVQSMREQKALFPFPKSTPLFSVLLNGKRVSTLEIQRIEQKGDTIRGQLAGLHLSITPVSDAPANQFDITFENHTHQDTFILENLVPFGTSPQHVYITGQGKHGLSRTHLFLPGKAPVNIIVPDNAWELGYASLELSSKNQVCALARRRTWNEQARRKRFETTLLPKGNVTYRIWSESYTGVWQEGLRRIFQERYLYDLEGKPFDESLYKRADLNWIRHAYAMHLIMGWDKDFYDPVHQQYQLEPFLQRMKPLLGGTDVVGIWPNWPMLGLDQRNQWDLLRDLPGGLDALQQQAALSRRYGAKFFISYNPWDESTRWEDHHTGMSDMIRAITADGVVLDTEGKSSPERQQAADRARPGVVMYSEGMAVPKDMPGIVAGRVHNALYFPPLLNLNKFIRPDFAIFRVAELFKEPIRREFALSLFNGYGTEINQFQPGRPDWIDAQYAFWGRILMIQRSVSSNFQAPNYVPLYPTLQDSIYVNAWPSKGKSVFTIFSLKPGGFQGDLFYTTIRENSRVIDLWNHTELTPKEHHGQWAIPVDIEGFSAKWLGTNNEGAVGTIAILPKAIEAVRNGDQLTFSAKHGDRILLWAGNPDYQKTPKVFSTGNQTISLYRHIGAFEGKVVLQLFEGDALLDEQILEIEPGSARLISQVERTDAVNQLPEGMVEIPAGKFKFRVTYGDNFIPHPTQYPTDSIQMPRFFMDKHPVTNMEFQRFLNESRYRPLDTTNFLKHWENGIIPTGQEQFPVVYVHYEDIQAYCKWANKRLPTEMEWQYAAQTPDGRDWPWAKDTQVGRETQVITATLTVSRLKVDSTLCNTGTGNLQPVGSYPKGANPYGLQDLTGCVWQFTHDLYANGSNLFHILKGGSYYLPASSWWYVEGGPRELTYAQKLLRISPGFERNATTGFRCVKDAAQP